MVCVATFKFLIEKEVIIDIAHRHTNEDDEEQIVAKHRKVAFYAFPLMVGIIVVWTAGAIVLESWLVVSFALVEDIVQEIIGATTWVS